MQKSDRSSKSCDSGSTWRFLFFVACAGVKMKLSAAPFLWGIVAFLLLPACSKEENLPPPRQKQKVVRPAEIPAGMPAGIPALVTEKPVAVPEEKKEA